MASWLDKFFLAYRTVRSSGDAKPSRSSINFTGDGVDVDDDPLNDQTTVTISGGSGDGGFYQSIQSNGTPQLQRSAINFKGDGVTVADGGSTDATIVTIETGLGTVVATEEDYTAHAYEYVQVHPSGGLTIRLPSSSVPGRWVEVQDVDGIAAADNITVLGNGHDIEGGPPPDDEFVIDQNYGVARFMYTIGNKWIITSGYNI